MGSDSHESRQPYLLDFADPVGPINDEGPTIKWAQHVGASTNVVGFRGWQPDLEALVIGRWEWLGLGVNPCSFLNNLFGKIDRFPTKEIVTSSKSLYDGIREQFLKVLIMLLELFDS